MPPPQLPAREPFADHLADDDVTASAFRARRTARPDGLSLEVRGVGPIGLEGLPDAGRVLRRLPPPRRAGHIGLSVLTKTHALFDRDARPATRIRSTSTGLGPPRLRAQGGDGVVDRDTVHRRVRRGVRGYCLKPGRSEIQPDTPVGPVRPRRTAPAGSSASACPCPTPSILRLARCSWHRRLLVAWYQADPSVR
jgi:hypothetical protein